MMTDSEKIRFSLSKSVKVIAAKYHGSVRVRRMGCVAIAFATKESSPPLRSSLRLC